MATRVLSIFEPVADARKGYWPALDGVRAFAVFGVIGFHAGSRFFAGGAIGVDVFFVLSGFLITAILLGENDRTGHIRLRAFYLRRLLRLFPGLLTLVVLCVLFVLLPGAPFRSETLSAAPLSLLYAYNWVQALFHPAFGLITHTWTLAVEEQFYLCWPVILLLLLRVKASTRLLLCAVAGMIAISMIDRALLWHFPPDPAFRSVRVNYGADTRADELLVGCFAGILVVRVRSWGPRAKHLLRAGAWVAAVGLVAFYVRPAVPYGVLMFGALTLIATGVAVGLLSLVVAPPRLLSGVLSVRPLVLLGRVSYGAYLWQSPVLMVLHSRLPDWSPTRLMVVGVPLIFGLAAASFVVVERRFLELKKRIGERP